MLAPLRCSVSACEVQCDLGRPMCLDGWRGAMEVDDWWGRARLQGQDKDELTVTYCDSLTGSVCRGEGPRTTMSFRFVWSVFPPCCILAESIPSCPLAPARLPLPPVPARLPSCLCLPAFLPPVPAPVPVRLPSCPACLRPPAFLSPCLPTCLLSVASLHLSAPIPASAFGFPAYILPTCLRPSVCLSF